MSNQEKPPSWDPDADDLAVALVSRAKSFKGTRQPNRQRRQSFNYRAPAGWSGPSDDDRDPQAAGVTVEKLIRERGWKTDVDVHSAVARWDEVVGAKIAAHVQPIGFDGGVITVRADSTAWATQLRLYAPDLVRRLNQVIGDGLVARVVVLGPVGPNWRKGARHISGRGPRDTYG